MSEKVGFLTVAPQDGAEPAAARRRAGLRGDPGADRRRGAPDRRRGDGASTEQLLSDNRERLDSLAEALLERETLDEADAYAAAGIERERGRRGAMTDVIDIALAEDIGEGDLTTRAVVPERSAGEGADQPEGAGGDRRAAGGGERSSSASIPSSCSCMHCPQGKWREAGAVAEISGSAASIVTAERVALNFLGRLSGIATLTARYVARRRGNGRADSRHPQDHAGAARAREGGGARGRRREPPERPVRRDPRQGEPREAGRRRRRGRRAGRWRRRRTASMVEVECATLDEVREALDAGVDRILLDNMSTDELRAGGGAGRRPRGARGLGRDHARHRPRGGRDRRRLHQRRRADPLGAGARRQPAARAAVGGRSTANGSVTDSSREPNR